jgi:predicted dehydrogenase
VVVTVKVPYHRELVSEVLNAGKSVYCECPLGNGLAEAVELARLANDGKLPGVVGTQAIASPEVEYVRKIVADGYVGEVLSATYIGPGLIWGNDVPRGDVYAMDSKNGATLLSVIGGHAISAVQSVLGRIEEVGAVVSQRRQTVRVTVRVSEPVKPIFVPPVEMPAPCHVRLGETTLKPCESFAVCRTRLSLPYVLRSTSLLRQHEKSTQRAKVALDRFKTGRTELRAVAVIALHHFMS